MCQAKRGRTGRASRDTNALRSVDSPRNLRLPGRNSRVGCVKQSADAPVGASRDTPRPKQDADENKGASQFHAQGPGAHRGRVGCVKQSADAPVAQAETLPVGRQLRWTHPTNSRCPMCVPGAA